MVLRPFHVDALFPLAGVDAPDRHRVGLSTAEWSAGRPCPHPLKPKLFGDSLGISGLWSISLLFRERVALRQCAIILAVLLAVVVLLTAVPHAVLLSASGRLFPSAFSASLIAIVCFFVVVLSLTYALLAGVARSMADVFELLVCGIRQCAPLFVIYILFIQFYESLRFVFW